MKYPVEENRDINCISGFQSLGEGGMESDFSGCGLSFIVDEIVL
jgi:hypothetical protein